MRVQEQATTRDDELMVTDERTVDTYRYESTVIMHKEGDRESGDKVDATMSTEDEELECWNEAKQTTKLQKSTGLERKKKQ